MANNYKNDQEGVENSISTLTQQIYDYSVKIEELSTLLSEIKESSDWQDDSLKPDFITTCQAFIDIYKKTINSLNTNMNYISGKCQAVSSLNAAYKDR